MTRPELMTFLPILPQILLLLLGILVLALDLALPSEKQRNLGWVTAAGMGLIMIISLLGGKPGDTPVEMWGGMVVWDWMSYVFTLLFLFGAAATALMAMDHLGLGGRGEAYVLLIAATIGAISMASAGDLVMLYLAVETVSIPMYVLAGFLVRSDESTEAGFKYLLFGAMTSALLLYGFSLIYGFSGTTNLAEIASFYSSGQLSWVLVTGTLLLSLVGLGFKTSIVPFHFWAPDVYQGSPTPISGYLSTVSKAAGFAALTRILFQVFGGEIDSQLWVMILTGLSIATMTLGNLAAMAQSNIKRMLAYSSIAHAGYILIGMVAFGSQLGLMSVIYYLAAYMATNLAAFGVIAAYGRIIGSDDKTAYYGMSRRSPGLALVMLVAFLSLAGMPPFAGFIAKVFIFAAAVDADMIPLAVIGILNSILGLYYYLTVLKYVYLYRSDNDEVSLPVSGSYKLTLGVLCAAILLLGIVFGPWFNWAATAAQAMVP